MGYVIYEHFIMCYVIYGHCIIRVIIRDCILRDSGVTRLAHVIYGHFIKRTRSPKCCTKCHVTRVQEHICKYLPQCVAWSLIRTRSRKCTYERTRSRKCITKCHVTRFQEHICKYMPQGGVWASKRTRSRKCTDDRVVCFTKCHGIRVQEHICQYIQPIADRVAQNLEIIFLKISTNQNSAHGIYD